MPDTAIIESLRYRIRAIEQGQRPPGQVVSLGPLDAGLPWQGLPLAHLHEITGPAGDETPTGFAAAILGLLSRRQRLGAGPVLWCGRRHGDAGLFVPGLLPFGLTPETVILVRARSAVEVLWAMEEGLRCPALAGVLGEVERLDLTAGRRLQLAAEAGGVTGLVRTRGECGAAGASTRWRIAAAPSLPTPWGGSGPWRAQVTLDRCRGGPARNWLVEWREENGFQLS